MSLRWENVDSYDLHVLRNDQPSLQLEQFVIAGIKQRFLVNGQSKEKFFSKKASELKADPSIIPDFEAIAYVPSWIENDTFPATIVHEKNGIKVNGATGEITAGPVPAGEPAITSFSIRVLLFMGSPNPHTVVQDRLQVLVHVHGTITNAWITPSVLNVRPDIIKGIAEMQLKILTADPIKIINLYTDNSFTQPMGPDLLLEIDPFDLSPVPSNLSVIFNSSQMLENRNFFGDSRVFYDPMHLEVLYVNSQRVTHLTIPLHLWYLNKVGDIIKDELGNDLFQIQSIDEKFQSRASLYAFFDDGTIGDISYWHGVSWTTGTGVNPGEIEFDTTGAFKVNPTAVNKTLQIKAELPPRLSLSPAKDITGNIKVDQSWLQTDLFAKPVPQSPLHPATSEPVNILFIAEGFEDETKFGERVRDLCKKLREDSKTAPWNYLFNTRIATWMLYIKSEERAATIQYESVAREDITLPNKDIVDLALPMIDLAEKGPKLSNEVRFIDLVLKVGIPVAADLSKSLGDKLGEWQTLFSLAIGSGNWTITQEVFDYWKNLGRKRSLVEERNTVFGLAVGSKPTLIPRKSGNMVSLNMNDRLDYQHIIQMLSRVKANDTSGELIGEKFWGRDKDGKFGKDFGLTVFLADGLLECGTRIGGRHYPIGTVNKGVAVGMGDDNYIPLKFFWDKLSTNSPYFKWKNSINLPSVELVPFDNTQLSISAFAVIAHELAHFFNLNDEYAAPGPIEAPPELNLAKTYNLQLRKDLLVNDKISGDKVKWRWPRIRKAGVMANDPVIDQPATGNITLQLKLGHARVFKQDEEVHLRHKDVLNVALDKLISPKLKIVKIDADSVILQPISSAAFQWADFEQGSLLILRTKASSITEDNPDHDEYAEILSPMIRKVINDNKTMTTEPCVAPKSLNDLGKLQDPENIPSVLSDPDNRQTIIGLYSGGAEYSCNIYHPSGQCIMRSHTSVDESKRLNVFTNQQEPVFTRKVYPFCHVCRYSLVDQIDPTQHEKIDKLYDADYPGTSIYSRNKVWFWVIGLALVAGIVIGIYLLTKDDEEDS